jgi:carbamoyl-phosphate synthase large subunit
MNRILAAAVVAALSACATAPTDIAFDAAGASSGATDGNVSFSADSKDAVLILAIGPIGTGGGYEFQPLNADRTDFAEGGVLLGFGAWGIGDKMKRPENEKSSVWVLNDEINFLINTPATHESRAYEILIRSTAIAQKIAYATNMSAAEATVKAIRSLKERELTVKSIQEYHA